MTRRRIGLLVTLALGLLVAPLAAEAQPVKVPRIGVLAVEGGLFVTRERSLAEFREALGERGYVEGQTILVDARSVEAGQSDRLNDLAVELVRQPVDLLVTIATPAVHAAKRVTTTIPIVFNAGDPVGTGLVASLARPGGNATGISLIIGVSGKCLDLLRELLPTVTHVAALVHTTDPFARPFLEDIQSAAQSVGVRIHPVVVRGVEELDGAFTAMVDEGVGAVIIQPILATPRAAALAAQHYLPTISTSVTFAEAGGLMTYNANRAGLWRSLATYVDKILKGATPADLPVERPMRFDLVINLKTANALGLTIPPTLLFQATDVIR